MIAAPCGGRTARERPGCTFVRECRHDGSWGVGELLMRDSTEVFDAVHLAQQLVIFDRSFASRRNEERESRV